MVAESNLESLKLYGEYQQYFFADLALLEAQSETQMRKRSSLYLSRSACDAISELG